MNKILIGLSVVFALLIFAGLLFKNKMGKSTIIKNQDTVQSIHSYSATPLLGEEPIEFSQFKGDVLLVVNTASKCGLTPQFEDLQTMHEKYAKKGLRIVGFPSDNFMNQEFADNQEISNFCKKNYGVTFQMFEKSNVKGENKHPIYQFLTEREKNGVLDSEVSWNFQKYLLDKDGKLVAVFNPRIKVTEEEVISKIEELL